jgi:hypothetical protein
MFNAGDKVTAARELRATDYSTVKEGEVLTVEVCREAPTRDGWRLALRTKDQRQVVTVGTSVNVIQEYQKPQMSNDGKILLETKISQRKDAASWERWAGTNKAHSLLTVTSHPSGVWSSFTLYESGAKSSKETAITLEDVQAKQLLGHLLTAHGSHIVNGLEAAIETVESYQTEGSCYLDMAIAGGLIDQLKKALGSLQDVSYLTEPKL